MISPTFQPLLTDFGLSRHIIASVSASTTGSGGSLRWKAPELADENGKANEQSDIWAFGMTIVVSLEMCFLGSCEPLTIFTAGTTH